MRDRKKRNIVIGSLCALLVFMGIGYAIISQMLTIKGVSTVAGDWNIYIDSITPNAVGTGVSVSESVGLDKASASFEANLYAPGDKVEYKVVVKNDGNIDAKLGAVNQHVTNDADNIVKYSNTLENGYILRHGESYVFYVTTEIEESIEELPKEDTVRAVLELKLNFTQYTGGSDIPTGDTIQILSGDIDTVGSEIQIGTEHFYVVPNMEGDGDDKISLFAKYNLLVGSDDDIYEDESINTHTKEEEGYNKQSENAKGAWCEDIADVTTCSFTSVVPFASGVPNNFSRGYWYNYQTRSYLEKYNIKGTQLQRYVYDKDNEYNTISEYVERYKEILESDYNIEVEEAKLLSFEQAINLLDCTTEENGSGYLETDCNYTNPWSWNTTYWIGSASDTYSVWNVGWDGSFGSADFDDDVELGVRPLIVLDKSLFN